MSDTIEERDGQLYVAMRDVLDHEPVLVTNFYPLGLQAYGMESFIGRPVRLSNGSFRDDFGILYALRSGPATLPAFTDRSPVPEPKQRGRRLETKWMHGAWHTYARNGWKRA